MDHWRCALVKDGQQCAMIVGIGIMHVYMQLLLVGNLDMIEVSQIECPISWYNTYYYAGYRYFDTNIGRSLQIFQLSCSGTEYRLSDCDYTVLEQSHCFEYFDSSGVYCIPGIAG